VVNFGKKKQIVKCLIIVIILTLRMSTNTAALNFVVTPYINNIQHFNFQLMHTTLKNLEVLKHFKISKTAPTCFGLRGNHHQGATVSTYLKITHLVKSGYVELVQDVSVMAAYCNQYTLTQCTVHTPHRSQYAAITLTTSCTASTYLLLTKCVIFS